MYNENSIEDYEIPAQEFAVWSTRKAIGGWVNHTFQEAAPVMKVSGEWLKLADIGPKNTPAWVAAGACRLKEVVPIQNAAQYDKHVWLLKGDYEGYGVYFSYEEMNNYAVAWIGKVENGFLVCPYRLNIDDVQPSPRGVRMEKNSNGSVILYWPVSDEYGNYNFSGAKNGIIVDKNSSSSTDAFSLLVSDILKLATKDATAVSVVSLYRNSEGLNICASRIENLIGY